MAFRASRFVLALMLCWADLAMAEGLGGLAPREPGAAAQRHIPGPDEGASPSEIIASSGSSKRAIRQRKVRSSYRGVRGSTVEDRRYLGRVISLDIASVTRVDSPALALEIRTWDDPGPPQLETFVVFFATRGASAPSWALYEPKSGEGWGLYRYNAETGLYDDRAADAQVQRDGLLFSVETERVDDMPRRVLAFVQTSSPDEEEWAWTDRAPTRKRGLRMR